ncbi:hypothetical protein K501DRAFT_330685 [Backusella circina FSU 941]|nr:hypothetical protein K501DRAFT_330685 [Backusella circina FSU 941]
MKRFLNRDKCCHCIPLKSGVLTIAFYIFIAACLFLNKQEFLNYTEAEGYGSIKVIYYFQIVLSIIYAMMSIFGFIGIFIQNLSILKIFKIAYGCISIVQSIFIIPGIVILTKYNGYLVTRCASIYLQHHPSESSDNTISMCENGIKSVLIIGSIVAVFICFLQFYFIIPIATYVNDVELMLIRKSYSRSTRYSHNALI